MPLAVIMGLRHRAEGGDTQVGANGGNEHHSGRWVAALASLGRDDSRANSKAPGWWARRLVVADMCRGR
jgi:hypothetical protein